MWNHIKFVQRIKDAMPFGLKILVIRLLVAFQYLFYKVNSGKINNISEKKQVIYLLLSTDYSNLGDHAMTYAHKKMLSEKFPDAQIVEIVVSDTLRYLTFMKNNIKKGDVITLKGGGNIGLEYFREELYRRIIIKEFKNNKIIIFPQTIYFPNTKLGQKEFENTERIFLNNHNLYLFTRDIPSYNKVKDSLRERVQLTPDIVLSLADIESYVSRQGAMICMRNDVEGRYSNEDKIRVKNLLKMHFNKVIISDTTTEYPIPIESREHELRKIWNQFTSVEMVITDRLHGMIFAAITGTPCIVFNTYNHKLIGQYEWLKHLNFIKFLDYDTKEIDSQILKFKNDNLVKSKRLNYEEYYKKITEII